MNTNKHSITVNNIEQAEAELFRIIATDPNIVVTEYRQRTYELEDIFMQIIEGGQDVRQ